VLNPVVPNTQSYGTAVISGCSLISALHGYLIWFGDILFSYALIGMLIFPLRNRKPRSLIIVACLMLLGMALMKLRVLSAERSIAFYRKMMLAGYGIGLPIMLYSIYFVTAHQWDHIFMFRIGMLPNYIGSIFVAMGHIAVVMLIVKTGVLMKLMQRFAAVGRMAFTNYLLHSIILTTVFYGYGFGLYGQIPRLWQMAFVVAVIGLQMIVSPLWLRHYRFGPAEWFWRSLTYWRLQPMRREMISS
jgi:uncharacterized protein